MKTTIDIPDPLYRKAKIRAVEKGVTLKELVISSLRYHLEAPTQDHESAPSGWANRTLLPDFKRLSEAGLMKLAPGERTIDDIISDIKAEPE